MDALMAALVAAALAQTGDRAPWLAAILADRYDRRWTVIVAAGSALAANYALASIAGALAARFLSPNAVLLLLAAALVIAGGGMIPAPKPPDRLTGWRLGGFATALLGLFIMAFGDSTQLIAFALAARSPVPWLAGVGATLGALAVLAPAVLLGEARYRALPLTLVRRIAAAILLIAGLVLGLSALRLI